MFEFSRRLADLNRHAVRETANLLPPGALNLAGGSPALGLMPLDSFQESCDRVFSKKGTSAFGYVNINGIPDLRSWLAERHSVKADNIIVTTGSQQSIDLVAKLMIDSGTPVAVENPCYVGARQVFDFFGADLKVIQDINDPPRANLAYVEPSFQNPTGKCWTLQQRKNFLSCFSGLVVEDDPFGDIYFGETRPVTLRELAPDRVVYLGSLSKIFSPGIRLAYIIAPDVLVKNLSYLKSAADMCSSSFLQEIVADFLQHNDIDSYLKHIRTSYHNRSKWLYDSLRGLGYLSLQRPTGGLFAWVQANKDAKAMHPKAIQLGFNYMPGGDFFIDSPDWSTMRLNYARITSQQQANDVASKLNELFMT